MHCETNWIDVRNCAHNRHGEVRLELIQRGDDVAGRLAMTTAATVMLSDMPISGRIAGETLTLTGSTDGEFRRFVENWSATVSHERSGATIQATFDIRDEQRGTCLSFRGCIDPIVWKRAYATSTMRSINE
jgi:hypothetical protein